MRSGKNSAGRHFAAAMLIVVASLAVFGQCVRFGLLSLDDHFYLSANDYIAQGLTWDGARRAFTGTVVSHWHPVTVLSHMLMVQLFGLDPAAHHAANVAIHVVNALLVYAVLFQMTRALWPSALVALVFAVHPLQAESVAWVAERKGLLCNFFGLLALWAYVRYARKPGAWRYSLVAAAFAASLMSKAALLALPAALLLLDYRPLGRFGSRAWWPLIVEKIPLFLLTLASAIVTYFVTRNTGAMQGSESYPVSVRLANAIESYVAYLSDVFLPIHLAPQYPHPGNAVFGPELYAFAIALLAFTTFALASYKKRPYVFVGWAWFIGLLVPLIGVLQVANQARADRYLYLPMIGLLVIVAWTLDPLRYVQALRRPIAVAAVAWILALGVAGYVQTARWKDDFTLFSYTVDLAPESSQANYCLGVAWLERGDRQQAEASFRHAIAGRPPLPEAHANLAALLVRKGELTEAAEEFAAAYSLDDSNPDLLVNYGVTLLRLGQANRALDLAEAALRIQPGHSRALRLHDDAKRLIERPATRPTTPR